LALKVSRIFAADLLRTAATIGGCGGRDVTDDVIDDAYLVTSDADLWPISDGSYDLPVAAGGSGGGADVLSLNAYCCGRFQHRNETLTMIPMANVGARASTWRNLTSAR